eukprot:m.185182 g.185182  ORF g.185182 m.185182 type:complete len:103 (+) comp32222_c0_seq10:604-912(+)
MYIGEGVKHSTSLEVLYLATNNIGAAGAKCIGEGVGHSVSLKELVIDNNKIGVTGAKFIVDGVKRSKTMEILDVEQNKLTAAAKERLQQACVNHVSLREAHF